MARTSLKFSTRALPWALTACAAASSAWAQSSASSDANPTAPSDPTAPIASQQITITGQIIAAPLRVGGFGDSILSRTPLAASLITDTRLKDVGGTSVSSLITLDAAVSAAYDADGYWNSIAVRGFGVDNRSNYRRDGLPINAETVINLGNKSRIELLKGVSGMQAGVSAPSGLVNLIVKRPTLDLRSAALEWRSSGTVATALDLSQRFGDDRRHGLRLNAAYDSLKPMVRDAEGKSHLLALAVDTRLSLDTLLEIEVESSRQSQPSVPGFSLLGATLPDAKRIDPRINLNNQAWTLPVVFSGQTASLRATHNLSGGWRLSAHAMTQRLRNEDRVAFPFGCSAEEIYDRYCSDGSFDFYDFRSEGERRQSQALDLQASGEVKLGGMTHAITVGALTSGLKARFQRQAFNWTGVGTIDGASRVEPMPELTDENNNRDERSTELYLRDHITINRWFSAWLGLRSSRLTRESARTDGSRAVAYQQSFVTPWLALSHQFDPQTMIYFSHGQGVETDVAPNRARYTNAGQVLPAMRSRQTELGLKHAGKIVDASVAIFDVRRPMASDLGACDEVATCTRALDGGVRHRGVEAMLSWRSGPWDLHASGMWLDAKRAGAADAASNGLRPTNVPGRTLRLHAGVDVPGLQGVRAMASVVHEGNRMVLPDNSIATPGWTRLDLAANWTQRLEGQRELLWRLGVDNVTNVRAWKEAPYQYGHAYLFPMSPRQFRVSMTASF